MSSGLRSAGPTPQRELGKRLTGRFIFISFQINEYQVGLVDTNLELNPVPVCHGAGSGCAGHYQRASPHNCLQSLPGLVAGHNLGSMLAPPAGRWGGHQTRKYGKWMEISFTLIPSLTNLNGKNDKLLKISFAFLDEFDHFHQHFYDEWKMTLVLIPPLGRKFPFIFINFLL